MSTERPDDEITQRITQKRSPGSGPQAPAPPDEHDDLPTEQLDATITEDTMDQATADGASTPPRTTAGTPPQDAGPTPSEQVFGPGTTSDATAPAPGSTQPTSAAASPDQQRLRVGTVVWGLVVAVIGVGILATAAGVVFDVQLALIGLVALAGVALLVGSVASGARRRRR
ncbi:hypothetical protein [Actinotalea sp. K2]|uniref:hypothetical protein n=1 Tax=Actinotalea sp. K2 TaxID=2939438 RepID=UPI002017C533|nr:hypothetical protein [Actinotalea sp. K2]MCL3859917.1 hypothetical protein [Actinotalea sp. K2]